VVLNDIVRPRGKGEHVSSHTRSLLRFRPRVVYFPSLFAIVFDQSHSVDVFSKVTWGFHTGNAETHLRADAL
jgi:hypothetical protein